MLLVPRAGAVRDTRGVIKMVADRLTRKVLGVSMHGLNAAEVIHEAAMGLRFGATIDDFARLLRCLTRRTCRRCPAAPNRGFTSDSEHTQYGDKRQNRFRRPGG